MDSPVPFCDPFHNVLTPVRGVVKLVDVSDRSNSINISSFKPVYPETVSSVRFNQRLTFLDPV